MPPPWGWLARCESRCLVQGPKHLGDGLARKDADWTPVASGWSAHQISRRLPRPLRDEPSCRFRSPDLLLRHATAAVEDQAVYLGLPLVGQVLLDGCSNDR